VLKTELLRINAVRLPGVQARHSVHKMAHAGGAPVGAWPVAQHLRADQHHRIALAPPSGDLAHRR
jgi:hypothetical protein